MQLMEVIWMDNNFIAPRNISELSEALRIKSENTYILAGGTDLNIKLIKDQIFDFKIIDISKLEGFKSIEVNDDVIKIGACVTMTDIENSEIIKNEIPALVSAAESVGSTQIRNRATIGGNLANAAQCGDTIPVLFSYDADVEILNSAKEIRHEKVRDFVVSIGKTSLNSDEVITSIIIKRGDYISGFSKVGSRKTVTISKINCCGKFLLNKDSVISEAEIYMGAVGIKPIKAELIENELKGKILQDININFEDIIKAQIEKFIPNRSSKYYKGIAAIGLIDDLLANLRR